MKGLYFCQCLLVIRYLSLENTLIKDLNFIIEGYTSRPIVNREQLFEINRELKILIQEFYLLYLLSKETISCFKHRKVFGQKSKV